MTPLHLPPLARLFFVTFAFLTDTRKNVTPADIERLHDLMSDTRWCDSHYAIQSLGALRHGYSTLWTEYSSSKLQIDVEVVARLLDDVLQHAGSERTAEIKQALSTFVDKFENINTLALGRLGRSGSDTAREQNRRQIDDLLRHGERKSAIGNTPANSESAAASLPTPLNTASAQDNLPQLAPAQRPKISSVAAGVPSPWDQRSVTAYCLAVRQETHDTKTYIYASEEVAFYNYLPGQFVLIDVDVGERVLRRSYTISSSPSRPRTLAITVKRVPKGWMSNWLFDNMAPGTEVKLSGPHGEFHLGRSDNSRLLLLAAGSGITPIMSMMRWMADTGDARDVIMINHVRTPADVIFGAELRLLATQLPSSRIIIVPASAQGTDWVGPTGRLGQSALQTLAPDLSERDVFVCGPDGYMKEAQRITAGLGLPASQFFQESFGGAPAKPTAQKAPAPVATPRSDEPRGTPAPQTISPASKEGACRLIFEQSGTEVLCDDGIVVLEAAEQNGIPLTSGCRAGICGACRIRKLDGDIRMPEGTVLSSSHIEEGYILACTGRAYGRVVLDC
ncbi:2Fe-2S iron-sulfur cluster-binding protein [Bordetella muralis]|jgi:glycine betaine catabolism B|uniref:2Fe-2S iron-sulfur cluster-binding protein n=1 Tax=Bordetella muralis TaxID=1649130 RepID=UPI0039EF0F77